ncbi:hypothetical protein ACFX1Q_008556 [Malus domestica]
MQSSLSYPHGITGFFKFQPNPISNQSPPTSKSFPFSHYTNTSLSSSSIQLALRSHCNSQPQLQPQFPSKPTWHLPSNPFSPIPTAKNARLPLAPLHCGISSNNSNANATRSFRDWVELVGEAVSTAFPIWVALGCLLGLLKPSSFNWVTPNYNILGLTLTMLGMGMTLTFADLRGALAMPKELLAGFVLQYSVMPLSGYFVSKLLNLPSYYAAGLILVGCCPGGTASNIVTYIARGNVALSVLMTAASTLSAVVGKLT